MKKYVNTAKIEYLACDKVKTLYSNKVEIRLLTKGMYISGEVFCRRNCRRWILQIYEKNSDSCVFCLDDCRPQKFHFETVPQKQYCIKFTGDDNSTLRLYSIPQSTTVCHSNEHYIL